MPIVLENLSWMSFNLFLAVLGVTFGWFFYYSRNFFLCLIFFILWVLFIPNTIYLITDLQHLPKQFLEVNFLPKILLVIQYLTLAFIGIITFIVSMYPVDKIFKEFHLKKSSEIRIILLILVNFFISFALVLGKYQRTHSWYVFSEPARVVSDVLIVLQTPILLGMIFFLGIVINLIYFGFKHIILVKVDRKRANVYFKNKF